MAPYKGRTFRKVIGGEGNFRAAGIFSLSNSLYEFLLGHSHEYFLGLIGVHEFFFPLNFPCTNIFFVLRSHKFSNGPSLTFVFVCFCFVLFFFR